MRPAVALVLGVVLLSGCAATTDRGYWGKGVDWPNGGRLGQSALAAIKHPQTWVPLAGAAVIGIGGWDHDISDWAIDKKPLFGDDAAHISSQLRTFSTGALIVTAFLTPSDSLQSRAKGVLVQGSTLTIEHYAVRKLKSLTGRTRPDDQGDDAMPSGHTSRASVSAALAATNLEYIHMPDWARSTMQIGLHGTAAATGWARVEAAKHYPTDVLVGYAFGQFLGRFMHEAFFTDESPAVVQFRPVPGGGELTLRLALH